MKKIFATIILVGIAVLYFIIRQDEAATPVVSTRPEGTSATTTAQPATPPAPTPTPVATPQPTATPAKTGYRDGVYTGSAVDAFYGIVQVRTTIVSGRITDVAFLKYPDEHGHTLELSQQLMPKLSKEVISIQNAEVDTVSGATETVAGFRDSLRSALAQAKA